MPIFFQQEIDADTCLAIWKIAEDESFFTVPLQREITHPHKRLQHLAGRYLLRYLFPEFPLELIKVADTRKPFLDNEAFHFSISHCSDYAAAIVSRNKRVGVDIEVPSWKVERIKQKFLHPEELRMVKNEQSVVRREIELSEEVANQGERVSFGGTPKSQTPNPQLTLLWSAKEAVFKWWSYGQVDFSEMIRIANMPLGTEGEMKTAFIAADRSYHLQLHYRLFANLCLVWAMD